MGKIIAYTKNHPMATTILIIIGLAAVILTLLAWFSPWSDTSVDYKTPVEVRIDTPEFYQTISSIAGSSAYPLPPGTVTVLKNGDEFVPDLLKEINGAKSSITMTDYIWKKGDLTNSLLDALTKKANRGIKVRVLMDAKGSLNAPQDKVNALVKAGGVVAKFRPLGLRALTRINKRTHVRAMVIDGHIGYIGGFAFDDEWLGDGTKPKEWRDLMFKMDGYGAKSIQDIFNDLWRQTTGEVLNGPDYYPTLPSVTAGDCSSSCFIPLFHSPTPDLDKNLSQLLWLSMTGSKKHIYLETPYLLPDQNILKALKTKVAQGVDVEIIVPGPYVDSRIVQLASRSYYKEILDAGIKLYEYQPAHLHAKIMTVDDIWSVIGSANLDNRSSTLNVEGVMGIRDAKLANDLDATFALDRSRSKEVTKDNVKFDIADLLFGHLSRLFAKQY